MIKEKEIKENRKLNKKRERERNLFLFSRGEIKRGCDSLLITFLVGNVSKN